VIPVVAKLIAYFLAQGALGWGFWTHRARPGVGREVFLTLFGLLILGGIALIAQIFNLHSDGWEGLRLWLVLMLPATLLAQSRLVNHIWLIGFGVTVGIWIAAGHGHEERRFMEGVASVYLFLALGLWERPWPVLPRYFTGAARFWSLLLVVAGGSAAGSIAWYSAMDGHTETLARELYLPWGALVVALAALFAGWRTSSARYLGAMALLLAGVTAFWTIPIVHGFGEQKVAGAAIFVALWSLAGIAAVAKGQRKLFDLITVVISLRFIVVYFEIFGSLAATGVGLILSGAVILGVAYAWHRYRRGVAVWLGAR
jgi:hypothetical protein